MLELWRKVRPATPPEADTAPVKRPATDALIPRSRRRHYPKVVMTLVLGLDAPTLRPLLAEIAAVEPPSGPRPDNGSGPSDGSAPRNGNGAEPAAVERALEPVLVTDCMEFALFRAAGVIFEYLPGPALRQRHAPDLAWDVYIARRLERLRHKWAPVRIVAIGTVARAVLDRQVTSPFSSPDLATLIGPTSAGSSASAPNSSAPNPSSGVGPTVAVEHKS